MAFWLMKSEPDVYSFEDLKKDGDKGVEWHGIRNYLARNNMRLRPVASRFDLAGRPALGLCRHPRRYGFSQKSDAQ